MPLKVEDIKKILVVGAGTMGHGIAEVAAMSGYEVYMADISKEILDNALNKIRWSLSKLSEKGALRESVDNVMARIKPIVDIDEKGNYTEEFARILGEVDFVIEAVPEKLELKQKLFKFMDEKAPPHTILATNTSSLPISEIAAATNRPDKVVGMHFFNPPPLMPLVEIIKGDKTSDETVQITYELAKRFGKQPVIVKKDVPGFIVNRILGRLLNEACWMVVRGEADHIAVDSAIKYKLGFPMGAFELADYSGIDVFYLVFDAMTARGFKIHGCPLFKEKYEKKEWGMKTGKGFYEYPEPGKYVRPKIPREAGEKLDPIYILAPAINEAAYLLREDIASKDDINKATKLGLGWPKGVFEYADDLGLDTVVKALEELKKKTGWDEYEPDPLLRKMVEEGKLGRKTGKGFYEYAAVEEIKKKTIIVRLEPPIAWIVLNRPDKLNAINMELLKEVSETLDELEENEKIRVIIMTGAGRAFSSGADISSFMGITPIKAAIFSRKFQEVLFKIEYYTKPVIAALNGYTLGGGMEMAMAADFRIAAETAMLGQPEINLGFIPGAGGTQRMPRLIGRSRAKEIIYTGDMIPATEAYKMGLVDRVVPPEKLEQEARTFALKLAEKPPLALFAAKYAIQIGMETNIWSGMALESSLFGLLFSTEDVVEGVTAFFEKRKPKFKGK
ncbi:MAG: 3-hydroxyacyl-CoA dehydrogenase/enoyl-CoA hydratase family protein [Pyrodictiaceae archaeon]